MKPVVVRSKMPQPIANYSEAFRVGDFVYPAGKTASDFKTGVAQEARINPAYPYYGSAIKLQTDYILKTLAKTLEAAGTSLDNVVKAQVFLTDLINFNGFDEVWKEYFKIPPPRTTVGTTGLLSKDTLVEIDLIAYIPRPGLQREVIKSDSPQPIANYSEAFRVGDFVFPAGKTASDFKTGVAQEARINPAYPYYGSAIKLQTHYILKTLAKSLEAAGTSLDNVVKAQVFLTDLNNFNGFDEVWKEYFKTPPPRTTVGTSGLLTTDALVEIDLIAYVPRPGLEKKPFQSDIPQPIVNYSEVCRIGDFVFPAGRTAASTKVPGIPPEALINPAYPYYGSAIKLQARYVLDTLAKSLEAAGTSLENVVKAQVFLTDLNNFNGFDEVWKEYFKMPPPRTTVGTSGILSRDSLVEVDLIATVD